MGRRAKLKQMEENQKKCINEIFIDGKMIKKLNFNPIDEIYKIGKHEEWFKRNILCVYSDGTMVKQIKNETGAYCFMALYKGLFVFADFDISDNPYIVKLDSVGFEELAIIKALKIAKELEYTQIVFFHDCITIQEDAVRRKSKKGQEFPLQWDFYDAVNSFEGNICFQKISSNENPYHNIVDKTLRATKSYIEYLAESKGEAKKKSMIENLKAELKKLLNKGMMYENE